jgi:hypothetical protein
MFSTVATTGDASTATTTGAYLHNGAALIGTKVFFAPNKQNNVGIYDDATSAFSTVATTGDALTGTLKYFAAAAIGTKVFFALYNRYQNSVGIYDEATYAFSTAATTGGALTGTNKYSGAAANEVRTSLDQHARMNARHQA